MNKVILVGFVGGTPEKKAEKVISFSLATHRRGYVKGDGTEVPDTADWHSVTCFDERTIKFIEDFVKKGSALQVEGEIRYSTYIDKDGIERRGTEIIASSVSFFSLGGKEKDDKKEETK